MASYNVMNLGNSEEQASIYISLMADTDKLSCILFCLTNFRKWKRYIFICYNTAYFRTNFKHQSWRILLVFTCFHFQVALSAMLEEPEKLDPS